MARCLESSDQGRCTVDLAAHDWPALALVVRTTFRLCFMISYSTEMEEEPQKRTKSSSSCFSQGKRGSSAIRVSAYEGDTGATTTASTRDDKANSSKGTSRHSTSIFSRLGGQQTDFQATWRVRLRQKMDGVPLTLCWCAFTCTILYSDLIRTALLPPAADPYFVAFTIVSMVVLAVEIILSSLVRPGYIWRFYMWMDLVASFSLLCDIPAFVDLVTFSSDDDDRHLTLERIAKAAQAGARAARIMQVVSVLQMIHLRAQRFSRRERRLSGSSGGSTNPRNSNDSAHEDGGLQFQMTTLN